MIQISKIKNMLFRLNMIFFFFFMNNKSTNFNTFLIKFYFKSLSWKYNYITLMKKMDIYCNDYYFSLFLNIYIYIEVTRNYILFF